MKPVIPFIRAPFNYDRDSASAESALLCEDVSLSVQSERDDCDINVTMERFGHGVPLPGSLRVPTYGDFTGVSDYRSALHLISEADESFMQLPAVVRSRFQNDPARSVEFCSDPSNIDELRSLGLADAIHPPASQVPSQIGSADPAHAEPKP